MDVRLICEECGVKWILRGIRKVLDDPASCASCGGRLIAFDEPDGDAMPGWTANPRE